MFEVICCSSCTQHYGRKSGASSAKCPHCTTNSGTKARVVAIVESSRDLLAKVAELNLPPTLRGKVPTTHSGLARGVKQRMSNEERVHQALRRVGASGYFTHSELATALAELEASANVEHVIAQAMEEGLIIQPRPEQWELVKG